MKLDNLREKLRRGRQGYNEGLLTGVPTVDKYTNGLNAGRYILVGAESGVGKSTFVDALMLSAIEQAMALGRKDVLFVYWSMEMSKEMKLLTWAQWLAAKRFGVLFTPDYAMNRVPGNRTTSGMDDVIDECLTILEKEYMPYIILYDFSVTPGQLLSQVIKIHENPELGLILREPGKEGKPGRISGYARSEAWKSGIIIGIIDHLALGTPDKGEDNKRMMDKMSRYMVITRNLLDMSWIAIQQFNTEMSAANRSNKLGIAKAEAIIAPQRLDFGDTKYTYRDAEVVIGLVSPNQFGLKKYMGMDVGYLRDFLVVPHIMKNRYGPSNKILPQFMDPLRRTFTPITPSEDEALMQVWYDEAKKLNDECQLFFPK